MSGLTSIKQALRELEEQSEDIDLRDGEAVCSACNLTYWQALGFCSNCRSHD